MRIRETVVPSTVNVGGRMRPFAGTAIRRFETDAMYNHRGQIVTGQDMGATYVAGDVISARRYTDSPPGYHISGQVAIHADGIVVTMYGAGDRPREFHYAGETNVERIESELGIRFHFEN